jgi:hypothetical protein
VNVIAGRSRIEQLIAAHLAEWETSFVELASYRHADPERIAAALDELCMRALGSHASDALFYQSSVAAVAGLVLHDGRRVVVKAHQPDEAEAVLRELVRRVFGGLYGSLRPRGRLRRPQRAGHVPSSARSARRRASEPLSL